MAPDELDDVDGCDVDMTADPLPDDHAELYALFAEGLDDENPKSVEQAKAEWEELFCAGA